MLTHNYSKTFTMISILSIFTKYKLWVDGWETRVRVKEGFKKNFFLLLIVFNELRFENIYLSFLSFHFLFQFSSI